MPTITDIEGLPVTNAKGKLLGRVNHVLFHPTEPRVVGLEVQPPAIGMVVERRPRYIALDSIELREHSVVLAADKPHSEKAAAARLGIEWERTVIWRYMPVVTDSGEELGLVRNVRFDAASGTLKRMSLTRGATSDVAIGRQVLDAALVTGFDQEHEWVRVSDEASEKGSSGGVAVPAGRGAAVVKIAAEETAKQAIGGAVEIAKAVKKADVGGRAKRGWRAFKDAFDEGMRQEGEE